MDAARSAYRAGDARLAMARFEAALREAESFGTNDLRLPVTLHDLARLYMDQGRLTQAEPILRRALAILEKTQGPDHPDVGAALNNLAGLRKAQGRLAEAESLYLRDLAITEKALGPDHRDVGLSLSNLAGLYLALGRLSEAGQLMQRSLAILEKTLGRNNLSIVLALKTFAEIYRKQGRYAEAEPLYRRSLEILEKAFGPDHPDVALTLSNLAVLHNEQGRYAEAETLHRRALAIQPKALAPEHPDVAVVLNNLADLYREQGRYAEAGPLYRRSLAINEKAFGPDHPDVATNLSNLAVLHKVQGRYAEAETLHRRALAIWEKALAPDHPDVGVGLNYLAELYREQGRYADAEPLYRRTLEILEKALGPEHPYVGGVLNNLALLYQAQGRYADAASHLQRSLGIAEKALGPDSVQAAGQLNNLAELYRMHGRYAEAEPLYLRCLRIVENTVGPDHPRYAVSLSNLALLYQMQGRFAEAAPLRQRAVAISEKALGPDHPDVARLLNLLADLLKAQGKLDEALALARRANAALALRFTARGRTSRPGALAEQRTRSGDFEHHVSLLAALSGRGPEARAEATREGFGIAQLARASDTAEQVAKMAARYAAGSDALAPLARARQDAMARFEQLDVRIMQAAGQRGNETLGASMRGEQAATLKAIAELDARLEREYPQYGELTNPQPLELAAAQKLLAKDEALLLLLVSTNESFLWVLRQGDAGFFRLGIKHGELDESVRKVRSQLDLDVPDPERLLRQPFNVTLAHELYQKILAPAEALLAGTRHLIFVPDGALQSLPPGVLVTGLPVEPAATLAELSQVPWLTRKYAITVLPAAGSLRALRQFAKPPASREPFSGFGDPVLDGSGETARRANVAALYSRGAVADANEVRKLARLPESAGELRAIAAALKAPAASIRLGPAATERAVKEADLTRYRNLAFATHGLMAGDFKGLAEPALVLTPPPTGSELDDGLLTASEISQLKLDADWVVLSACNTAAPDGTPGAEGLSGLARAFFYAGARSLLVSHWAVSSDAAVALTTRMFEESAQGAPKAEALRRSMLALMARTDKPYFAHPALWAPFVVVGEGNAQWAAGR
ncbi:MAG: tetratricopeptide repeat protein [Betaproteobacteria bacterium]|nr:tetratricopeptide repeat protein [Betaproteobacteria bacterium]